MSYHEINIGIHSHETARNFVFLPDTIEKVETQAKPNPSILPDN